MTSENILELALAVIAIGVFWPDLRYLCREATKYAKERRREFLSKRP